MVGTTAASDVTRGYGTGWLPTLFRTALAYGGPFAMIAFAGLLGFATR
jgi:hypothetical protein